MALFTRSLWPETARRPYLRLAAGVVAAPLLLAAGLTLIAFLIAGSSEPDRESTLGATRYMALVFFTALPAFTLTFGAAGVALLWALGRRGVWAWLAVGGAAGIAAVAAQAVLLSGQFIAFHAAAAAACGLAIFALIRWIAGIRLR